MVCLDCLQDPLLQLLPLCHVTFHFARATAVPESCQRGALVAPDLRKLVVTDRNTFRSTAAHT
ncbi:MAG: hypothetical protein AUH87_01175 [Deltaproteobacteria bacterium 13_1_40CM_4_54_4]|nr:MAG: hypothetical protein AUH87_01175 [Deltaproteobacteria bacterium 13_1_40CM_4_54_4]